MNDLELAGYFLLIGIVITIIGNWISNLFQHKQKIEYMKEQNKFNKKIEVHMKVINLINDIQEFYNMIKEETNREIEQGIFDREIILAIKDRIQENIINWREEIKIIAPERDLWCSKEIIKELYDYWTKFMEINKNKDVLNIPKIINSLTKETRIKLNIYLKKELKI